MRDLRLHVDRVLCKKWRLLMRLGEGGVSTVWAGEHRNSLRVALKVLRPELSADSIVRGRFLREGYVANRIRHPGVVSVLDDDCDDGIVFMVMDLLRGETLKQRMRRQGVLTPREVVKFSIEVLGVLEAAHAEHVLHRDIKPDNVFLVNDGSLKLLDFGVARLREMGPIDHHTKKGAMLGTPAFMPPEQALGHWDRVDVRSDLFALGATMWTLLTGRLIHPATTTPEMLVASSTRR
ncbi:MAG TPA: serine/threonine-protein kinase, partial [Polyangiaceae bacterium]|nr:serine/threonine-protein kinase [Polyangiaceae bacterium]